MAPWHYEPCTRRLLFAPWRSREGHWQVSSDSESVSARRRDRGPGGGRHRPPGPRPSRSRHPPRVHPPPGSAVPVTPSQEPVVAAPGALAYHHDDDSWRARADEGPARRTQSDLPGTTSMSRSLGRAQRAGSRRGEPDGRGTPANGFCDGHLSGPEIRVSQTYSTGAVASRRRRRPGKN